MPLLDVALGLELRDLLLLMTAIGGFAGSYYLYTKRLRDRRRTTRKALLAEIENNKMIDSWIRRENTELEAPSQIVHSTIAYESNVDNLGLLTNKEVELVTEFYSNSVIMNDVVEWNRKMDLEVQLAKAIDNNRSNRINTINSNFERLALSRWKAVQVLRKNLGEDHEPIDKMAFPETTGDVVSKYHPAIAQHTKELKKEGYFEEVEPDSDLFRLTEEGEEFLLSDSNVQEEFDLDHELSLS